MKKMKQLLAVVLALALMAGLAACGGSRPPPPPPPETRRPLPRARPPLKNPRKP